MRLAILFALFILSFTTAADSRFLSNGVSIEGRQAEHDDYSLKIMFTDTDGHYVAGVDVTLTSSDNVWGRTRSEGPWLFVNAPRGSYNIEATRQNGPSLNQQVEIPAGRQREIIFRFPVRDD